MVYQYQPSKYPLELVLSQTNRINEEKNKRKMAPLDNLVNALTTLSKGYSDKKALEAKNLQEGRSMEAKAFLEGKTDYTSPASSPEPGAEGPSAPERPYYPQIQEILKGNVPQGVNVSPNSAKINLLNAQTQNKLVDTATKNQKMQQMQWVFGLQQELSKIGDEAFKAKYGEGTMQTIKALPAFNILDLMQAMNVPLPGMQSPGALPGVTPPSTARPEPATPGAVPSPVPQPVPGNRIKVKEKATGRTGTINENEFDPKLYERI